MGKVKRTHPHIARKQGLAAKRVSAPQFGAAVTAFNGGDLAGAAKICSEILQHNPDNLDALSMLGVVESLDARDVLERAIALAPDDADALHNLSRTLAWMGEFASAE
jgi:Flp pilus assembly protein TadD